MRKTKNKKNSLIHAFKVTDFHTWSPNNVICLLFGKNKRIALFENQTITEKPLQGQNSFGLRTWILDLGFERFWLDLREASLRFGERGSRRVHGVILFEIEWSAAVHAGGVNLSANIRDDGGWFEGSQVWIWKGNGEGNPRYKFDGDWGSVTVVSDFPLAADGGGWWH